MSRSLAAYLDPCFPVIVDRARRRYVRRSRRGNGAHSNGDRHMSFATVLGFLSVFFAGMLAGMEFVIHHGVRGPAETLDDRAQLQLRQALVLRLRVLIPAFFVPTAVFGLAVTALAWTAPGWWFRIVGL